MCDKMECKKNAVIILAGGKRFLSIESQLDEAEDLTSHTHTHTLQAFIRKFSVCLSCKTDFPEKKTTSLQVEEVDQQTPIAADRELTLQAFRIFFLLLNG